MLQNKCLKDILNLTRQTSSYYVHKAPNISKLEPRILSLCSNYIKNTQKNNKCVELIVKNINPKSYKNIELNYQNIYINKYNAIYRPNVKMQLLF